MDRRRMMVTVLGGGASVPVVPWYLAATGKTPVAAYQPAVATSLADSYINVANPGVHDAFDGVPPAWTNGVGWTGASGKYLKTDLIPSANWSAIIAYTVPSTAQNGAVFGGYSVVGSTAFSLIPNWAGGGELYYNGGQKVVSSAGFLSGFVSICGQSVYKDGSLTAEFSDIPAWSGTGKEIYLMCSNQNGTAGGFFIGGSVRFVAIFDTVLSAAEQRAVVLAALAAPDPTPYLAYVETSGNDGTAEINNPALPFATINAALDAVPGARVDLHIGAGTFAAVTDDTTAATSKLRNGIRFYGSGQPTVKADHTGLETGTIIKGTLTIDRDDIELYDFGVDSGSAVCASDYGGVAQQGIQFANIGMVTTKAQHHGFIAKRISVICKAYNSLVHAFLVENCVSAVIDTITTCYGFAGVVLKTNGATVSNINCTAHNIGAVYCKTNTYAAGHDTTVNEVVINSVAASDCVPILFANEDAGSPSLFNYSITNVTNNSNKGVQYSSAQNTIVNCDVVNMSGISTVTKSGGFAITNCEVNGTPV